MLLKTAPKLPHLPCCTLYHRAGPRCANWIPFVQNRTGRGNSEAQVKNANCTQRAVQGPPLKPQPSRSIPSGCSACGETDIHSHSANLKPLLHTTQNSHCSPVPSQINTKTSSMIFFFSDILPESISSGS